MASADTLPADAALDEDDVKAVILAGGRGTRLSEETTYRPKPMVEIGGRPLLWHIMKCYERHDVTEFIVCLGYKGDVIKEYFANYYLHRSDVTFDLTTNEMLVHQTETEPWRVTLVDTGDETMTGGRLRRVLRFIDAGETFCFTYGDGVGAVDITASLAFHRAHGGLATMTAVRPPARFGAVAIDGSTVQTFSEKPVGDGGWINGGFFVLERGVDRFLDGDATVWEHEPLERLAGEGQLHAFQHDGFWHPVDTMRDKEQLQALWDGGEPPWLR